MAYYTDSDSFRNYQQSSYGEYPSNGSNTNPPQNNFLGKKRLNPSVSPNPIGLGGINHPSMSKAAPPISQPLPPPKPIPAPTPTRDANLGKFQVVAPTSSNAPGGGVSFGTMGTDAGVERAIPDVLAGNSADAAKLNTEFSTPQANFLNSAPASNNPIPPPAAPLGPVRSVKPGLGGLRMPPQRSMFLGGGRLG